MKIIKNITFKISLAFVFIQMFLTRESFAQAADIAKDAVSAEEKTDYVLKMVAYYGLIFLLLCIVIALVGKILHVYELTRKFRAKKKEFLGISLTEYYLA